MKEGQSGAGADELALHARLVARDPTAPAEAAERYLPALTERLLRSHRDVRDSQIVEQAAIDAVFSYIQRPEQYDPSRRSLAGYLLMAANGDLANALAKERRHRLRAISLDDDLAPAVELRLAGGNGSVEEQALAGMRVTLPPGLSREEALRLIMEEFPEPSDRRLLQLRLDGERRTEPYAAVLGLSQRPVAEQRRMVKRAKDRIDKRLQRLRTRLKVRDAADAG